MLVVLLFMLICVSCNTARSESESQPSEKSSKMSSGYVKESEQSSQLGSGNESEPEQPSPTIKKDYHNFNDIVEGLSEQLKKNKITKTVETLYVPEILVDAKDEFSKMNPKAEKNDVFGMIQTTYIQFEDPPLSVGKYKVFISEVTYFEQPQDTTAIKRVHEEIDKAWRTYTFDGKDFAFACTKDVHRNDDFCFNLWYYIDDKTRVFFSGSPGDNIDIDTEEKAIAVFKDFQCKTIGEALQ